MPVVLNFSHLGHPLLDLKIIQTPVLSSFLSHIAPFQSEWQDIHFHPLAFLKQYNRNCVPYTLQASLTTILYTAYKVRSQGAIKAQLKRPLLNLIIHIP